MSNRSRAFVAGAALAAVALAGAPQLVDAATTWPTSDTFTSDQGLSSWILPAGSYSGNRYADLTAITPSTVKGLKPSWRFKLDDDSPIETSPIIWNGMMYVTSAHDPMPSTRRAARSSGNSATART